MLGDKTSFSKFKKIEIISSTFCNHNDKKLEIIHKNNTEKYTNSWRLNNVLLNNERVNNEIKGVIKSSLGSNKKENTTQNLWDIVKATLNRTSLHYMPPPENKEKLK